MRNDLLGLFFDDTPTLSATGKVERVRPMAKIPETGWVAPKDFPNLFDVKLLGLDVETFDPELKQAGPGWARGIGHLVGISLATEDSGWYFPIRHETRPEENLDPELVLRYLKDLLAKPMDKVGANILYDKGWLRQEGVSVNGRCYDVQYAEALLDDVARSYSLDNIAKKYLGTGKVSYDLYKWSALSFGGKMDGTQRANIYRSPPSLVGPYAEADASQPLLILKQQFRELKAAGLWDLFIMECDLIPVLEGMRFRGLPIDAQHALVVEEELGFRQQEAQEELDAIAGFSVGVNKSTELSKLFDKFGIKYPYTDKGNPSFTAKFLSTNDSKPAKAVSNIRKLGKAKTTFVRNAILDKHIKGVLYPSFHPLRGEDGGAVSGRYSSSMPNAQQIPARDEELAPLIRSLFIPEPGFDQWIKLDLSQIEYRMFAHYSNDNKLITEYQDPTTDYHNIVSGFLNHLLIRKIIKNFNFMSLYGGGKEKTIGMIGEALSTVQINTMLDEMGLVATKGSELDTLATHFIHLYATNFPAAKRVMQECSAIAANTGEIRTILNRRSTFNLWEPMGYGRGLPLPKSQAIAKYGVNIKIAATYKALNRKLQGSAADLLKKGMLDAFKTGLFASGRLGFPHVTVHDELDFSYNPEQKEDFYLLKQTIEQAIPLKVPVIMDVEIGTNWGNVKEVDLSK